MPLLNLKLNLMNAKMNLSFMVTPVANDVDKCIITTQHPGDYPQVIDIDDLPLFTHQYFTSNQHSNEDE
ncbi:hypothetical protein [Dipodfec virus UA23Rod_872]|uniref:Uncharacterized protein n=1 Tax=Dipodfec virus UA23Rod_872 TaxID=2929333 RepID=A0A976N1T8_9VIRU|nr:hypothetical protein [Dipodfec virus UA23Rod_872]